MINELKDFFLQNQEGIIADISALVEIESPSHDVEGIAEAVDWVENKARKFDCVSYTERIKFENYGEHLLVRAFQKNTDEKQILLLGHLDTVHPRGTKLSKNPTRIEDGKLYGCGSFDMKAGVCLMLAVLQAFENLKLTPKSPITLLLACDEEIGSPTGREIVEREARKSKACLVLEPAGKYGAVKTGRKGTGNFRLKTHGIPSHAGLEPQRGASAILEISRQIPKIHELNDYEKGTTANVCTIHGGTASNVIPAEAECEIDVRFTQMSEAEKIESAIRALKNYDERVSLEVIGEINRPPMERTPQVVALYEKAREIARQMDYELRETQVGGASDGNFVGALGVPVLDGLGVKGDGAHTFDEYIEIADIAPRAALVSGLLLEL